MERQELERELEVLNRRYPQKWYHNYHFGAGLQTIPGQSIHDNFLIRADLVMELVYAFLNVESPETIATRSYRLLDVGCGEGLQAIEAAFHGFETVGVEGRDIFLQRAEFAKRAFGVKNVRFVEGDVRKISRQEFGVFDVTLCLGILYHIDKDSLLPFIRSLSSMTGRLLILDTHIANDDSLRRYKLQDVDRLEDKYVGRVYSEHPKGLTTEEKRARLRASLENERSFWFEHGALCQVLHDHGFEYVFDVKRPVHNRNEDFLKTRVLMVALKGADRRVNPHAYLSAKSFPSSEPSTASQA